MQSSGTSPGAGIASVTLASGSSGALPAAAAGEDIAMSAGMAASAVKETSIRVVSTCGLARTGVWRGLATPLVSRYTVGGCPPYITPGAKDDNGAGRVATVRFSHVFGQGNTMAKSGLPLSKYLPTGGSPVILTVRDTAAFTPSRNGANHLAVDTSSGRCKVTPKDFATVLANMRPDVAVCMAHEVDATAKRKHQELSVSRSKQWLEQVLAEDATRKSGADLFAVVTGGTNTALRTACAEALAEIKGVNGFVYGGLGAGESHAERGKAMQTMASVLPRDMPRMVAGIDGPWDILQAVACGADIIDSAYPYKLAESGYAATFPNEAEVGAMRNTGHGDGTKIQLADHQFALDERPLLDGCTCFTCKNHTRAYIHHLLDAHEMLGFVLLYAHNEHHLDMFLATVRGAIARGELDVFVSSYATAVGIE